MKLKKMLSIILAVALVLAMTVSVSAKRLDINGDVFVGTLAWSGTPYVYETLTATTKLQNGNPDPAYGLQARLWGEYRLNNGQIVSIPIYQALDTGVMYNLSTPEVFRHIDVQNGCWLQGNAYYAVYYRGQKVDAQETKQWNV